MSIVDEILELAHGRPVYPEDRLDQHRTLSEDERLRLIQLDGQLLAKRRKHKLPAPHYRLWPPHDGYPCCQGCGLPYTTDNTSGQSVITVWPTPQWTEAMWELQEVLREMEEPDTSSGHKHRGKRGRQFDPDISPDKDRRLCEQWKHAKKANSSRKEFCRNLQIEVKDLIRAQDRERHRPNPDAE